MIEVPIPATLRVGGLDYRVRMDAEAGQVLDGLQAWGQHRCAKREILIDPTVPAQELTKVFLHECLHAVEDVFCGGSRLKERDIGGLAQGLLQVMENLGIRFVIPPAQAQP